jgi:hypothetical protein
LEEVDLLAEAVAVEVSEVIEGVSAEALVAVAEEVAAEAMEVIVEALDTSLTATDLQMAHLPDLVALVTLVEVTEVEEAVMGVTEATVVITAAEDPVEPTTSPWAAEIATATVIARVGMAVGMIPVPESVAMKVTTTIHDSAGGTRSVRLLSALCYGLSQGYLPFRLVI